MKTEKNYTEADVARIMEFGAVNADNIAELAEALGKTVASVRAKAVMLKVYTAKAKGKAGAVRKADLVAEIAELADINADVLETLVAAKIEALVALRDALAA